MNLEKIETRNIVPVAARINSGKSKLLNVLYNINFLECKSGIATKFINLLRYNPNISKPCFYHLILENNIFYKNKNEFYEGEENIIEANKNINKKFSEKVDNINYNEIFYMTEINDVPFIQDKEYLLTHDLCDIPGLNEYQSNQTNIEEKESENNEKENDLNIENNIIQNNENNELINCNTNEDDIFYKTKDIQKNTYLSEIFEIIKNDIDGAIIIFSIEDYYFEDNFELIAKLHRVINKQISNFLVILNKMDLSENPDKDIEKFKGEIIKHFPKCQTFNINLNTFIPLSVLQVQNELLMDKSFRYLINYHFYNYIYKVKKMNTPKANIPSFISHLTYIIKSEETIKLNDIKTKINNLDNSSEINNEISSIIKDLLNEFKAKGINFGINEKKINEIEDEDDDDSDDEKDINNIEDLSPFYILKILYICHKEKKLIPPLSKETQNLINYFQTKRRKKSFSINYTSSQGVESVEMKLKKYFGLIIDKLNKSKIDINKIKSLRDEIIEVENYLKSTKNIFIPFLGPSNAGKTTILNGIIGKNILPTYLNECTKRGIIIRYSDKGQEEITISKSTFTEEENSDKTNYIFNEGYVIGQGLKEVTTILKGLNYEFTEKEEDCFYYIKTKIKLFDDLGLNDSLKRMIYLIDIPGYGTNNKFLEKNICQKIISISSAFIFVIRNSIIKENNTKKILDFLFNQTKIQKKKLYSGIIKSCAFILNNDNSKNIKEDDLIKAKKDIQQIIGNENSIEDNLINLGFFNAKYYSDYCDDYNYFFNLEETFENEYNNYMENMNNIFKWPELIRNKKYNSFFDFLSNQLNDKLKNKFGTNIKKLKAIKINNENVRNQINKIYKNLNIKMEEILKKGDKIIQIFFYAQEKIKELSTLKESNIENLSNLLNSHFNYIYNNQKEKLKNILEKNIYTLDEFTKIDFCNKKINEIDEFNIRIKDIKNQILELLNNNKDKFNNIFKGYKKKINFILKEQKDNIQNNLKNNNCSTILNEIDNEMKNEYNNLNKQIIELLNNFNKKILDICEIGNKQINEFSEGKVKLPLIYDFKEFLLNKIGDKNNNNIYNQLFIEIKSTKSLLKIYEIKGFSNFIKSSFSSHYYISNNIEIILGDFTTKVDYILNLLNINLQKFIDKILHIISVVNDMATIIFKDEQLLIWNDIKEFYFSIKNNIEQAKNELFKSKYD